MPLYEIHHSHTLTAAQQRALATSITALHCSTFSAPSLFVNVVFLPSSTHFVGGAAAQPNYIIGHLRPRGPENGAKLATIVAELTRIWNAHVRLEGGGSVLDRIPGVGYTPKKGDGRLDDVRALHGVFLMEDIAAGAEQGFALPVAGQDGAWVRENMAEFRRRAEDGDEGMRALVEEVKSKL